MYSVVGGSKVLDQWAPAKTAIASVIAEMNNKLNLTNIFPDGYEMPNDSIWCRTRFPGEETIPHADMYHFQANNSLFKRTNTVETIVSASTGGNDLNQVRKCVTVHCKVRLSL